MARRLEIRINLEMEIIARTIAQRPGALTFTQLL
jgi:hypothetical protein